MSFFWEQWEQSPRDVMEAKQAVWDRLTEEKLKWLKEQREERLSTRDINIPTEKEFYAGRNILLTGGTGFVGKVIIEKILRIFPDVNSIYVIVRPKRGQNPQDRIRSLFNIDLFDKLRSERPNAGDKLVAISGDMSEEGLGLSPEDRILLQNRISVVIHSAASVKFDDALKKAVLLNTRGTHEMIELCKGMRSLVSFIHVSTTYCNTNEEKTLEKVYPTPYNWRTIIKLAENTSAEDMEAISYKILGFQPNTYTFTKQLSEKIVDDARHDIPVAIVRLAVVQDDPLPGWIDNLNGPSGINLGIRKGLLRVLFMNPSVHLNFVPVDISALIIVAAAWLRGTNQRLSEDPSETDVANVTGEDLCTATYDDIKIAQEDLGKQHTPKSLRLPSFTCTSNEWYYMYRLLTSHVLFGLFVDLVIRLSGEKPRILKIYRKIHQANTMLRYFTLNMFVNETDHAWKIVSFVTESQLQPHFRYNFYRNLEMLSLYTEENILIGKDNSYLPRNWLIVLDYVTRIAKFLLFLWLGNKLAFMVLDRLRYAGPRHTVIT